MLTVAKVVLNKSKQSQCIKTTKNENIDNDNKNNDSENDNRNNENNENNNHSYIQSNIENNIENNIEINASIDNNNNNDMNENDENKDKNENNEQYKNDVNINENAENLSSIYHEVIYNEVLSTIQTSRFYQSVPICEVSFFYNFYYDFCLNLIDFLLIFERFCCKVC